MPNLPARPCSHPGCRALAKTDGRCDNHPKPHNWPTENRHERGYGTDWVKLRDQVLERDQYLCQPCLRDHGVYTRADEVDHKIPKASGGTDDPDNLQSICTPCHKAKTKRERIDARWPSKTRKK